MNEPVYHLDSVVRARAETLEDFDGPLDVILLLLSKNKIEIQDVNITSILEQYLAWLDERKRMDMEVASEFIAMASHLMYIKTRMLLSKAEQEEAESDMEILIRSLRERQSKEAYEQIKLAASQLSVRNEIGLGLFTKGPEPYERDQTYRYRHDPSDLLTTARSAACRRLFPTSQASSARSRIPSSKRRPKSSAASSRTASCASRPSFRAAAAALRSWRPSSLCSNYVNSNPYRSTTRTTRPSPTARTRTSRSAPDKEPLWNKMISSAR